MTREITPEMIAAWRTLQQAAAGAFRLQPEVRRAINVLDNSDWMVLIEEAGRDGVESYVATGTDPAEWGDTTREDMTRHQEATPETLVDPHTWLRRTYR